MRDVDQILEAVRSHPGIPPVHKQVLINRIEPEPTRAELDQAAAQVYPDRVSGAEPKGLRDPLGTVCAGCGHPRNFHEYSNLICVAKLDRHGFSRCGCTYQSPHADQATTATGSQSSGVPRD